MTKHMAAFDMAATCSSAEEKRAYRKLVYGEYYEENQSMLGAIIGETIWGAVFLCGVV